MFLLSLKHTKMMQARSIFFPFSSSPLRPDSVVHASPPKLNKHCIFLEAENQTNTKNWNLSRQKFRKLSKRLSWAWRPNSTTPTCKRLVHANYLKCWAFVHYRVRTRLRNKTGVKQLSIRNTPKQIDVRYTLYSNLAVSYVPVTQ